MESDWRSELTDYFAKLDNDQGEVQGSKTDDNARTEQFFALVAVPAFEEIKAELEKHGRQVTVGSGTDHVSIKVTYQDYIEFDYSLYTRGWRVYPVETSSEAGITFSAEGSLRNNSRDYTVRDITKIELIQDCLKKYKDSRLKIGWTHGAKQQSGRA
jgi:hypothetical protein